MTDQFFFTGLDDSRWFGCHFEGYVLFGYVGDRERLLKALRAKPLWRKVVETVLPRVNVKPVLKLLTGYDLGKVASDNSLAKTIIVSGVRLA